MTTISAVYRNGTIVPTEPVPADWPDEQPLRVEPDAADPDGPMTEAEIAEQLALMDAIPPSAWTDEDQAAFDRALADLKAFELATRDQQDRKIEEAVR
jgi:hypothetical protein